MKRVRTPISTSHLFLSIEISNLKAPGQRVIYSVEIESVSRAPNSIIVILLQKSKSRHFTRNISRNFFKQILIKTRTKINFYNQITNLNKIQTKSIAFPENKKTKPN